MPTSGSDSFILRGFRTPATRQDGQYRTNRTPKGMKGIVRYILG